MEPTSEVDEGKRATLRRFAAFGLAATPMLSRSSTEAARADDNEVRNAIVGYLSIAPGVHFSKIRDDLQLGTGETQHHLRALIEQESIERYSDGDYKRYVPANRYTSFEKRILGYLRRETTRGMIIELLKNPTLTTTELADRLEVSTSSISKYAGKLETAGLLDRSDGYRITDPETILVLIVAHSDSLDSRAERFAASASDMITYDH